MRSRPAGTAESAIPSPSRPAWTQLGLFNGCTVQIARDKRSVSALGTPLLHSSASLHPWYEQLHLAGLKSHLGPTEWLRLGDTAESLVNEHIFELRTDGGNIPAASASLLLASGLPDKPAIIRLGIKPTFQAQLRRSLFAKRSARVHKKSLWGLRKGSGPEGEPPGPGTRCCSRHLSTGWPELAAGR